MYESIPLGVEVGPHGDGPTSWTSPKLSARFLDSQDPGLDFLWSIFELSLADVQSAPVPLLDLLVT